MVLVSVSASVEPTSLVDTSSKADQVVSVEGLNPQALGIAQIEEFRAASEEARPNLNDTEPVSYILPEYVYFKNPAGKYLTRIPNNIGWYGLRWEPTLPDYNCRFKIIQVPNQKGKFYVTGESSGHQLDVSFYKKGLYDADVSKSSQLSSSDRHKFHLVTLGGNDIFLVRDALYDQPIVFLTNSDNQRYKLWDHNNSSWLDCVRSTTYANDNNKISVERAVLKTEVYNVRYNVDAKEIIALDPTIAVSKVLENRKESDDSQSVAYTYTKSDEGNWNNTVGIEMGQSFSFEASVPFIASTSLEISFTESYSHSWGGSTTTSHSITTSTNVSVPARTSVKVTVTIHNTRINIPFTYTEKTTHYDGLVVEVNKEGIYRNVQFINDHAVSEVIARF